MIHAPMACGGEANGVRLLSPSGADPVFDEQTYGQDLVLPLKLRHGIGFGLPSPDMPISPNQRACYWGGWGGSLAVIDLDARMTFAYVMNKMGESTTGDLRADHHPRRPLRALPDVLIECSPSSARAAADTRHEHSVRNVRRGFGPGDEVVGAAGVDDPLDRDVDLGGPVAAVRLPLELAGGVGVAVDREPAAGGDRPLEQLERRVEPLRPAS